MKRLLLPLLLLFLSGCKYGSEYEAREACQEWARKQTGYYYCKNERSTKKVLGMFTENKFGPSYGGPTMLKKKFNY